MLCGYILLSVCCGRGAGNECVANFTTNLGMDDVQLIRVDRHISLCLSQRGSSLSRPRSRLAARSSTKPAYVHLIQRNPSIPPHLLDNAASIIDHYITAPMNSLRLGLASRVISGARPRSSLAAASSSAFSQARKRDESTCRQQHMGPLRPASFSTTVSNVGLPIPLPFKESK